MMIFALCSSSKSNATVYEICYLYLCEWIYMWNLNEYLACEDRLEWKSCSRLLFWFDYIINVLLWGKSSLLYVVWVLEFFRHRNRTKQENSQPRQPAGRGSRQECSSSISLSVCVCVCAPPSNIRYGHHHHHGMAITHGRSPSNAP